MHCVHVATSTYSTFSDRPSTLDLNSQELTFVITYNWTIKTVVNESVTLLEWIITELCLPKNFQSKILI